MGGGFFGDLRDRRWIVAKGILFAVLGFLALALNLTADGVAVRAVYALVMIWAFCRFYYFLFYVLEKYVDPARQYAGIVPLLRGLLWRKRADP